MDFNRSIIIVTQTKSKKNRNVPMNGLVIETLQSIERKSEFVFCDPKTGEPYHSIKTAFGKALKRAGLEGLRFHDLRHTAATIMVMSGIDLITAGEILGHSDPKMTKRYVHPTTEGKINAVKALEKQMEDIDKHNSSTKPKLVSLAKVVSHDITRT